MNESDHGKEFREQGYTIARGFFRQEEMEGLIEEIKATGETSGLSKGALQFYSNSFLHSKKIQDFLSQPRLIEFLARVIGPDFWVRWDQAVFKGPGAPEFPWHQDNGYNGLKDEHYQLWVALSKMNPERGGLWLVPGSHKYGVLPHKSVGNHKAFLGGTHNATCIEAEVGDLVLFSSMLLHYTSPNVSNYDRWAYVAEYMSLDHYDPYIKPPYFVVARNGKPRPEFVENYRGRQRVANHIRYFVPRMRTAGGRVTSLARQKVKALLRETE